MIRCAIPVMYDYKRTNYFRFQSQLNKYNNSLNKKKKIQKSIFISTLKVGTIYLIYIFDTAKM